MSLQQLKEFIQSTSREEDDWIDTMCFLMSEKNISYQSLFGEVLTVEFENPEMSAKFGKLKITREGMPVFALNRLVEYIKKSLERQNSAMRRKK